MVKRPSGAISQRGLKNITLIVKMEQLKQKKKKYNDLDEILKSEGKKKKFFSFKNERVEKMEFFNRYCPDYSVVQTLKDEEEESESASNFKLSTREFFAGVVDGNNGLTECPDIIVAFQKFAVQKKRKHYGLSSPETGLVFLKFEDIFTRGQHDQYDLPMGELSFVSELSSENVDSKYNRFSCHQSVFRSSTDEDFDQKNYEFDFCEKNENCER